MGKERTLLLDTIMFFIFTTLERNYLPCLAWHYTHMLLNIKVWISLFEPLHRYKPSLSYQLGQNGPKINEIAQESLIPNPYLSLYFIIISDFVSSSIFNLAFTFFLFLILFQISLFLIIVFSFDSFLLLVCVGVVLILNTP